MCVYPVCARIFGCVFSAEIEVHTERTPPPPSAFRHVRASSVRTPRAVPDVLNYFNSSARANASERIVPESTVKMCVCVDRSNRERWRRICLRKRARASSFALCRIRLQNRAHRFLAKHICLFAGDRRNALHIANTDTHRHTHTSSRSREHVHLQAINQRARSAAA